MIMSKIGLAFSVAALVCAVLLPLLLMIYGDGSDYLGWGIAGAVVCLLFLIGGSIIGGGVGVAIGLIITIILLIRHRTSESRLPVLNITLGSAAIIITALAMGFS